MRIQAKELRCKTRESLEKVIPLPAPYVVYIDPTNACNFRCAFCPTSDKQLLADVGRDTRMMRYETFTRVVDELKAFDVQFRLINLYKDGEPLLNKRFIDMVKYLRDAGITDRIWTKTNGALLDPRLNQQLADSGLNHICISVEAVDKKGYKRIADVDIDYQKFRDNVSDLYQRSGNCEIYIKIADSGLSKEQIEKFYADFEGISDKIAVEKLMGWSNSDAKDFTLGTDPDTYDGGVFEDKQVCAYPFYVLAVNATGLVSVCGNDWSQKALAGDNRKMTLKEIWNGEQLYQLRRDHLQLDRSKVAACADCYYLKIVPDNIDSYRLKILDKISKGR